MLLTNPKKYFGWLIIPILYTLIFWRTFFSPLVLLDDSPTASLNLLKSISAGGYSLPWTLMGILDSLLQLLHSSHLLFHLLIIIGMLVSSIYLRKLIPKHPILPTLIYLFNPFSYSRIIVGQIGLLFSYLTLPLYTYYLIEFFRNGFSTKNLSKLALAFTLTGLFAIHFYVISFIIFIAASIFFLNKGDLKPYSLKSALLAVLIILLNIQLLMNLSHSSTLFQSIDASDQAFFSPKLTQDVPAIAKIIGMWGFWREGAYITTYKTLPLWLWYSLTLMFPLLMLIGYYSKKDNKSKFFYSLWWIGLIFATGISHPYTAPLFDFLFKHLPFFSGFRDSHKFVALIALSYAYLCPIGIIWIRDKIRFSLNSPTLSRISKYLIPSIFIALILLYTYPLIGLWGQIKPAEYPQSYQETASFIDSQNITGHIIYLPWEGYLTYNWTVGTSPDGRIAVPINNLVKQIIIVYPGQWGGTNELQQNLTLCLNNQSISCLENRGVQYILNDRCASFPTHYSWINLSSVHSDSCIDIYQLNNKIRVDRTIHPPLRFIIGSLISLITLIGIIIYLVRKR